MKPIPMDQVPAVVLKTAKEAAPDLTFYAAYKDKFNGQDSIELKGKTKTGKIKNVGSRATCRRRSAPTQCTVGTAPSADKPIRLCRTGTADSGLARS